MKRWICILWSIFALPTAIVPENAQRVPPQKVQYTPEQIASAQKIKYFIIVYQENWSFDSRYGKFTGVNGMN
jgi:phospholipase C